MKKSQEYSEYLSNWTKIMGSLSNNNSNAGVANNNINIYKVVY